MDNSLRKDLFDALKHTRLIHFTLVVVSATLAYVVISIGSGAPDILQDLTHLRALVRNISRDPQAGIAPLQAEAWSRSRAEGLLEVVEKDLGTKVEPGLHDEVFDVLRTYDREVLQRDAASRFFPVESASLQKLRANLEQPFHIRTVVKAQVDQETLDWMKQHLREPATANLSFSATYLEIGALTDSSELENGDRVANLELRVMVLNTDTVLETGASYSSTILDDRRVATVSFQTTDESVVLPASWLAGNYPRLSGRWSEYENMPIDAAIAALQANIGESLDVHEPNLLGIAVHGRHIGFVGPIAILTVLLYLWTYLRHIAHAVQRPAVRAEVQGCDFVPWFGAMPGRWPATFMVLSLVLLPSASVAYAVYRVFVNGPLASVLPTLLVGFFGALCTLQSRKIVQCCRSGQQS